MDGAHRSLLTMLALCCAVQTSEKTLCASKMLTVDRGLAQVAFHSVASSSVQLHVRDRVSAAAGPICPRWSPPVGCSWCQGLPPPLRSRSAWSWSWTGAGSRWPSLKAASAWWPGSPAGSDRHKEMQHALVAAIGQGLFWVLAPLILQVWRQDGQMVSFFLSPTK